MLQKKKKLIIIMLGVILSLCGYFGLYNHVENAQSVDAEVDCLTDKRAEKKDSENVCFLEGEYISFDNDCYFFATGERIVANYSVHSQSDVVHYDYTQENCDDISIEVVGNEIRVGMAIDSHSEGKFNLSVKLSSGEPLGAALYVVSNGYGTFISPFSKYDAYENYFVYAKNLGAMTEEECRAIRNDLNRDSVISKTYVTSDSDDEQSSNTLSQGDNLNNSGVSTLAYIDTYVKGTLKWQDDDGKTHPLRGVMLNIIAKKSVFIIPSGPVYTDNSGNFTCTLQLNSALGEYNLTVQVYAGDLNAYVKMGSGTAYTYEFTEPKKITACETKECGETIFTMDSDLGRAMQISQALIMARDYARDMMGVMPADVTLRYPYSDHAYYSDNIKEIQLTGGGATGVFPAPYASWDVIMHEYGHHIQYEMNIIDHPGGQHTSSNNDADIRENKDAGVRLAWAESWPTVFGLVAQDYWCNRKSDDCWDKIDTVGDTRCTAFTGANYNLDNIANRLGEACEQSIMGVLWDLFDGSNDGIYDFINLGYQGFWDITATHGSKTFSDFINVFYEVYPKLINDLAPNLERYRMAAEYLAMGNDTVYTLPRLYWTPNGGRTEHSINNRFVVVFSDNSNNEIVRTSELSTRYYEMDFRVWDQILMRPGDSYFWTVYAYHVDSAGYKTGPYISEKVKRIKPVPASVGVDTPIDGEIKYEDDYKWYKFVAPQTGSYTFYTEGTTDTYGALYSAYSYSIGTNIFYKSDDDGGEGNNFSITTTLVRNYVMYLRVSAPDESVGPYTLKVRYNGHEHIYVFGYEEIDNMYHKSFCDCGEYISERHEMTTTSSKLSHCERCKYREFLGGSVPGGTIQSVGDESELFVDDNRRRVTA